MSFNYELLSEEGKKFIQSIQVYGR